jgi:hypothetical protein
MGTKDLTHNPSFYFSIGTQDHTDSVREKLETPQAEAPATISINAKPAVRQVVRGEVDHLRITYFEGQNNFFRVFCWSLESKAASFANDFDKVAESFRERQSKQ